MKYLSVCSGIEAASVAWKPLGWEPVGFAEIDKFASAVLKHHFPDVPNFGDFTKIGVDQVGGYGSVDILVGGTPCQSFSVAGKRLGMDDPRGNLAIEFLRLAKRIGVRWILYENVPGLLSSAGGRDFGAFLGLLGECGYGWAYRILDAQFFGVPQRRRRVFLVGHLGDARRAAAVLLERASLSGHPAPRRKTREETAGTLGSRSTAGGGLGTDFECDGGLTATSLALKASGGNKWDATHQTYVPVGDAIAGTLPAGGPGVARIGGNANQDKLLIAFNHTRGHNSDLAITEDAAPPVTATHGGGPSLAFSCKDHGADAGELSPTLRALEHDKSHANAGGQVAIAFTTQQEPKASEEIAMTITADSPTGGGQRQCVALQQNSRNEVRLVGGDGDIAGAIAAEPGMKQQNFIATLDESGPKVLAPAITAYNMDSRSPQSSEQQRAIEAVHESSSQVRRLTPRECERLMAFPDDYTLVQYRNKPAADGPRYRALGNSIVTTVLLWIGTRIDQVESTVKGMP